MSAQLAVIERRLRGSRREHCAIMLSVNSKPQRNGEARDARRLLRLLTGHRRYASIQVAVAFTEGFLEAAILTMFARLALVTVSGGSGLVYVPGIGQTSFPYAFVTLASLVVVRFAAALSGTWAANRLQFGLIRELREHAVQSYTEASWTAQDNMDHGALQQHIVALPNGISSGLSGLILYMSQIFVMIAMLSYALLTDALLTCTLILIIGSLTFIFKPLRLWIRKRAARALQEQRRLSAMTAELSDVKFEIQAFGVAEKIGEPIREVIKQEASLQESASRIRGSIVPAFTSILYLAVTFGIFVLTKTSSDQFEKTGPILLVVLRSLSYGAAIQQAASGIATIMPSIQSVENASKDLKSSRRSWGRHPFQTCESLALDSVSYRYPGSHDYALKEISLEFSVGGKVGIVGPSGGGKSTLIRLALGVIDPTSGQVRLNGRSINHFARSDLSRRIAVVPQAASMLQGTIAHNLTFFREGISVGDMWAALRVADLEDEIRDLPEGLETVIGAGHVQLSGGQRQRLAIARAFSGKPELVVMDEPTSAVDLLSEASISDAVDNLPPGVTVLIVSHRMRILEGCDQLVVVENGRLSAAGPSDEILSTSEYVRSLEIM